MKKTILLSLIFALAAAFFAYAYLADIESKYKKMAEPVSVVVAKQRITPGIIVKKEMLAEKLIPKEYVQPKAFSKISALITKDGESVYTALNAIEEGEQILSTKVSRPSEETGITNIIPEGLKAIAVNFDNVSATVITPGTKIDVLCIIRYADKNKQYHESVYVIAQNILVLASGSNYIGAPKKKNDDSQQDASNIITLAVTVEEAQTIILAADKSKLKFIIRPSGDDNKYEAKPLKISDIVKDISVSEPLRSERQSKDLSRAQLEALEMINKYANGK
ncbi:MAG: Flp pilus assembly protein CpaB [Endomicrobium sp.]|jgi:pilus assembly protein CpaB|nr:Flp pilus assembly protein CpaB [Endomicrobium sp.]